jgi:DNA-binding transcriptional ArsR family regulator
MADERAISPQDLKLLAEPTREFLYQTLVAGARTATELARLLDCPTTRLYHHLKLLEKHGLIIVVAERMVSGIIERRYRAVARRLRLDRSAFGAPAASDERMKTVLDYVLDRTRDEIERSCAAGKIDLALTPPQPGALLAYRSVLKLTAADRERLLSRLHALYVEYEALSQTAPPEDGEFYGLTVAAYPTELRASDEPKARGALPKRSARGGGR